MDVYLWALLAFNIVWRIKAYTFHCKIYFTTTILERNVKNSPLRKHFFWGMSISRVLMAIRGIKREWYIFTSKC